LKEFFLDLLKWGVFAAFLFFIPFVLMYSGVTIISSEVTAHIGAISGVSGTLVALFGPIVSILRWKARR
jgi:hypothetical protein